MKIKVKKEIDYEPKNSYRLGNPYTIAFVYPKDGEPYILKGGARDVNSEISKETRPSIIHETFFKDGESRNVDSIKNLGSKYRAYFSLLSYPHENDGGYDSNFKKRILKKVRNVKRRTLIVYETSDSANVVFTKTLRHIPRKWMKELNQFVS